MESKIMLQEVLDILCPGNEVLYDDVDEKSIMVKIPRQTYAQLGIGDSSEIHPAFIVNGREAEAIYISKYENIISGGRAYSLPLQRPAAGMNFDEAYAACEKKDEAGI